MSWSPCLVRSSMVAGEVRYALGDPLVDRYLEFVAGRARPNTLRAVVFDLKTFFAIVGKDPVEVTAVDVFEFLAAQRGDRSVVRLADGESGRRRARSLGVCRRCRACTRIWSPGVIRRCAPIRCHAACPLAATADRDGPARCRWCACRGCCRSCCRRRRSVC